jgi:DNA-binding SARP family transcriptional activator
MTSGRDNRVKDQHEGPVQLLLLEGFDLRVGGHSVSLPLSGQRTIAFLALLDRPVTRSFVAESLWPDTYRRRSSANLRSSLWRVRQIRANLIDSSSSRLRLGSGITADVRDQAATIRRLVDRSILCGPNDLGPEVVMALSKELLPDWFEEWLLLERERWNQLRLHALEALAERLMLAGEFTRALEAALAAVWAEPLRESAHRTLIRIYAAEGNSGEAVSQYRRYRKLLDRELSLTPTAQMEELIRALTPR